MTSSSFSVGVFVPEDNRKLIERLIEPNSNVSVNDLTKHHSLEIYIGESGYVVEKSDQSKNCFIMTEPPEIMAYSDEFLDKFDFVVGPRFSYLQDRENLIASNPVIPHFVGVRFPIKGRNSRIGNILWRVKKPSQSYIENISISNLISTEMKKTKSITAIVSSKQMTSQQINRVKFLEFLERNSKIPIKIHGGLKTPVQDKLSIMASSTHHIAIENSIHDDYWTEKFADSILSLNYTFYCGASNMNNYFDKNVFTPFSLTNFKEAQRTIEDVYFYQSVDIELLKYERLRMIREHSLMGVIRKLTPLL